jgi:hypothetical protein
MGRASKSPHRAATASASATDSSIIAHEKAPASATKASMIKNAKSRTSPEADYGDEDARVIDCMWGAEAATKLHDQKATAVFIELLLAVVTVFVLRSGTFVTGFCIFLLIANGALIYFICKTARIDCKCPSPEERDLLVDMEAYLNMHGVDAKSATMYSLETNRDIAAHRAHRALRRAEEEERRAEERRAKLEEEERRAEEEKRRAEEEKRRRKEKRRREEQRAEEAAARADEQARRAQQAQFVVVQQAPLVAPPQVPQRGFLGTVVNDMWTDYREEARIRARENREALAEIFREPRESASSRFEKMKLARQQQQQRRQ